MVDGSLATETVCGVWGVGLVRRSLRPPGVTLAIGTSIYRDLSTVNIQSKMTGQRLSDAHSSSAQAAHTQPPTTLYTLNNNNNEWRW
eukprot:scaffold12374_cov200-Alexandrium_tamarense.AAC.8